MTLVRRVECIEVSTNYSLSQLCHQVKNLYNRANFLVKNNLTKNSKFLDYYDIVLCNCVIKQYFYQRSLYRTMELIDTHS